MRVAVVGAGVIGLAAAWRLSGSGVQATVYDDAPGSGPTRVAAGMLAPVTEKVSSLPNWFWYAVRLVGAAGAATWPSRLPVRRSASAVERAPSGAA